MLGRMRKAGAVLLAALVAAGWAVDAASQGPPVSRRLVAGVFPIPPFAMKGADDRWEGVSVALWEEVAREMGAEFELRELEPVAALAEVAARRVDVLVAPLAVTPEREQLVDFGHMFYVTGLGIAVPLRPAGIRWLRVLRPLVSTGFLGVVAALLALVAAAGAAIWLLERRRNRAAFGGPPLAGFGAGFWWSTVTFATVGYGDKVPITLPGRVLAVVWMMASTVLVSAFTGYVTAQIAVGHLDQIRGRADLASFRIAAVAGSVGEDYLNREGIHGRVYEDVDAALRAVTREEADGLVHGEAVLRFVAHRAFPGRIRVLADVLERDYYAFALPPGSALREPLNVAQLRVTSQPGWRAIQRRYLGS
jgi:ABC-type amino acid transport substrate-binding protein